jgi:hypothetical protein
MSQLPQLSFQFVWMLLSAIFGAGVAYATMSAKIAKAQTDANNIARIMRDNDAKQAKVALENETKQERRWKHGIANQIEELEPKQKARLIANLLREDAWRT